jgi:two-component system, sensor histidine kinase and response regulator
MTVSNSSDRDPAGPAPPPAPAHAEVAWGSPALDHCFRRVVEQSPSSIVVTDTTGHILYVNPAFERQTGYTAAEATGQNPRILNARTQGPEIYEAMWKTISSGREWSGRLQNRRKDGSLYWEKAVLGPIFDTEGHIIQYIAVKEDITALTEAEERNRWLGALLRTSPDICAVRDLSDHLIAINDAYLQFSGKASEREVLGRTDAEVFGLEPDAGALRSFNAGLRAARALPPGGVHQEEVELFYPDHDPFIFRCSFIPIHDEGGHLLATASIARDVSHDRRQTKALEAALERAWEASKAKTIFLGTVSHELRTPLNAIIGHAATLTANPTLTMETRLSVEWIQRSGELLLSQIEGLLQYTRLQAGETRIAAERFALLECFTDAIRFHRETASSSGLTLSHAFDPLLPASVVGDPIKLRRILNNLVSNALKFTDEGTVHVAARHLATPAGDWLRIEVADTGIGIAADALERIFHPFFQVDGTDTRRHGGAGLGLSITRGLAHALGGRIQVESEVGQGTRFTVELPLAEPSAESLFTSIAHPALSGKTASILAPPDWKREGLESWLSASGARFRHLPEKPCSPNDFHDGPEDLRLIDYGLMQDLPSRLLIALQRSSRPIIWLGSDQPMGRDPHLGTQYHLPPGWLPEDLRAACAALFARAPDAPETGSSPESAVAAPEESPLRFLIVDDLESNRTVVKVMLRHLGYESEMAENGARALEAVISGERYDMILMDLQMPVMDGFEATRRIRAHFGHNAGPRIIALTANAEEGVEERCRHAGMDAYLAKPITPPQITATVRALQSSAPLEEPPAPLPAPAPRDRVTRLVPLIDEAHLRAFVGEMDDDAATSLLAECRQSFARDCEAAFARLRETLSERHAENTIEVVHGLKGGAAMLAMARFRTLCETVLTALRAGTFAHWGDLAEELEFLAERSFEALDDALRTTATLNALALNP